MLRKWRLDPQCLKQIEEVGSAPGLSGVVAFRHRQSSQTELSFRILIDCSDINEEVLEQLQALISLLGPKIKISLTGKSNQQPSLIKLKNDYDRFLVPNYRGTKIWHSMSLCYKSQDEGDLSRDDLKVIDILSLLQPDPYASYEGDVDSSENESYAAQGHAAPAICVLLQLSAGTDYESAYERAVSLANRFGLQADSIKRLVCSFVPYEEASNQQQTDGWEHMPTSSSIGCSASSASSPLLGRHKTVNWLRKEMEERAAAFRPFAEGLSPQEIEKVAKQQLLRLMLESQSIPQSILACSSSLGTDEENSDQQARSGGSFSSSVSTTPNNSPKKFSIHKDKVSFVENSPTAASKSRALFFSGSSRDVDTASAACSAADKGEPQRVVGSVAASRLALTATRSPSPGDKRPPSCDELDAVGRDSGNGRRKATHSDGEESCSPPLPLRKYC